MARKKVLNLKFAADVPSKANFPKHNGILCQKTKFSGKLFPMHSHSYIEFEYLTDGNVIQELNGVKIRAGAGFFHFLDHNDIHSFKSNKSFKLNNICIDIKKAPSHISTMLLSISFPYIGEFSSEAFERVKNWFEIMYKLQNSDESYTKETLYLYFGLILIEILKSGKTLCANNSKSTYKYVKAAEEYIESNYKNHITLNDIAKHLNLAPTYLSQIFPKYYGCGFVEYLNSYRVSAAKELILSTDLSLTEIALDSGFGSHCAFSRAFNKYEGCSAREFKLRYKNHAST